MDPNLYSNQDQGMINQYSGIVGAQGTYHQLYEQGASNNEMIAQATTTTHNTP